MRMGLSRSTACWIVAAAFLLLQLGIGLAPPPIAAGEAHHRAVSAMADCRMCVPANETAAICAPAACFKANFDEEIAMPGRRPALAFAPQTTRIPAGFETRPPTRPA